MKDLWNNNLIQFARLLSEIHSCPQPLTYKQTYSICEAMNITRKQLNDLVDRALQLWEQHKQDNCIQLYDTTFAQVLRESGDLLSPTDLTGYEEPMTVREIDHWMRLMHEHKLETTCNKDNQAWYWYRRGDVEQLYGPYATFIEAVAAALEPYLKEEEP